MYQPATDKQVAFLTKLVAEKDTTGIESCVWALHAGERPSKSDASILIDHLLKAAPKADAAPITKVEPGYYVLDGQVYCVVESKSNAGRTYAKALVISDFGHASWQYAAGAVKALAHAAPLTLERAKELGHLHGICCICGRQLTDPNSVEAGIGPVCATKLGY